VSSMLQVAPAPDVKAALVALTRTIPGLVPTLIPRNNIVQRLDHVSPGSDSWIAYVRAGGRGRVGPNRREIVIMGHFFAEFGHTAQYLHDYVSAHLDTARGGVPSSFRSNTAMFYSIAFGEPLDDFESGMNKRLVPILINYAEIPLVPS
jgi:hypothetical protein